MRRKFTDAENAIIIEMYPDNYSSVIAQKLGRTIRSIYTQAGHMKIKKSEQFLKMELANQGNRLKNAGAKYRFNKGSVPSNKGKKQTEYMSAEAIERSKSNRFKKGDLPHNSIGVKDGDIRIRQDNKTLNNPKPYKFIRLSLGKWYPLHQKIWEDQNGKVSKGMCLWFKDGDTLNCVIENLELITRAENMRRNSISQYPEELKMTIKLTNKIKRKIEQHEK